MIEKVKFTLAALILASSPALGQEDIWKSEFDFFRDLQTGQMFGETPNGMPSPRTLSELFAGEVRNIDWASRSERELNRALDRFELVKIVSKRVRCNFTICEIMLVVDGSNPDASAEIGEHLGQASEVLGKELTIAMGALEDGRSAILGYVHDEELAS